MNDYAFDIEGYAISFLLINTVMLISGYIGSLIGANRRRMEKRGYPESYIRFTIDFKNRFGWRFALFVVFAELTVTIVVLLITGRMGSSEFLSYVFIPAIMLSIPYAAYYSTKANREYKKMALEEKRDIVVDFQRRYLKDIFSLPLEIAGFLLVSSHAILFLPLNNSLIIFLYVLLPWFFAATLVLTKNYIKPVFKDSYMMIGKMNIIYQILLILLLILVSVEQILEGENLAPLVSLTGLTIFLSIKIIKYIPGYKRLKTRLEDLG